MWHVNFIGDVNFMKKIILYLLLLCTVVSCFACNSECVHEYDSEVTIAATCSNEGTTKYTCKKCGNFYTESIEKKSHDFGEETVLKEATCSSVGEKGMRCKNCNYQKVTDTLIKTDHKYEDVVREKATCKSDGEQVTVCNGCGDIKSRKTLTKLEHSYKSKITQKANYKTAGVETFTCEHCQDSYTKTIEKLSVTELMDMFESGVNSWLKALEDIETAIDYFKAGKDSRGASSVNNALNDLKIADAVYWNSVSKKCDGYPEMNTIKTEIEALSNLVEKYCKITSVTESNYFSIISNIADDASAISDQIKVAANSFGTMKDYM